jgi:hypothetical protein
MHVFQSEIYREAEKEMGSSRNRLMQSLYPQTLLCGAHFPVIINKVDILGKQAKDRTHAACVEKAK